MGCLLLSIRSVRRQAPRALAAAAAVIVAAIVFVLFVGTRRWVGKMSFSAHYLMPVAFMLQMGLVLIAVAPLCAALPARRRKILQLLTAPALLLAAVFNFGSPSLQKVREGFDRRFGKYSADLVAGRATHLAGSYWVVWPAVFHANLILHEQGSPCMIWGLTYRGEVTQSDWLNIAPEDLRIGLPYEDASEARSSCNAFGFPRLTSAEMRETIHILRPELHDFVSKQE